MSLTLPFRKPKPDGAVTPKRAALVGGLIAGVAGFVASRRSRGGGPGGGGGGSSVPSAPLPPPAPSNYDAPQPPVNGTNQAAAAVTDPLEDVVPGVDEEAEVAAAADEAASIGGDRAGGRTPSDPA